MRYNPNLEKEGKNPLQLDSGKPSITLDKYIYNETRFKILLRSKPEVAKKLLDESQKQIIKRWNFYKYWSEMPISREEEK